MISADGDPIPWEYLRGLGDMEQRAWWSENITPVAAALVGKLSGETDRSYTDCVLVLLCDNLDLVRNLILERRSRREGPSEHPEQV